MSILIKGMEIPKVPTRFIIFADGRVEDEDDSAYKYSAVPVPPHGRLIDADALVLKGYALSVIRSGSYGAWRDDVPLTDTDAAPTIIPAELQEEEKK